MNSSLEKKNVVGLIYFILILDNQGKRLYSKYFVSENNQLSNKDYQHEFEKKLCKTVVNYNVNKSEESKKYLV